MRLPIDTTTIKFAAAGAAEPVLDFATKSQKTDENGVPLFSVPVFAAGGGIKDSITVEVEGEVGDPRIGCTASDVSGISRRQGQQVPPLHFGDQWLFTVAEVSQVLRLSRSTIYELLYAGAIRSVKIGNARRVRRSDLETFGLFSIRRGAVLNR